MDKRNVCAVSRGPNALEKYQLYNTLKKIVN